MKTQILCLAILLIVLQVAQSLSPRDRLKRTRKWWARKGMQTLEGQNNIGRAQPQFVIANEPKDLGLDTTTGPPTTAAATTAPGASTGASGDGATTAASADGATTAAGGEASTAAAAGTTAAAGASTPAAAPADFEDIED